MTASIRSALLADVKAAVETIDGTVDFENDLGGRVEFWEGAGISLQAVPKAVVYWLVDTSLDQPVGYLTRFLDVIVDVYSKDQAGMSSAEHIESLLADVERAVLTDPTRGGVYPNVDTKHVQSAPFSSQEGSPSIGGSVRFRIQYYHVRAKPDDPGS